MLSLSLDVPRTFKAYRVVLHTIAWLRLCLHVVAVWACVNWGATAIGQSNTVGLILNSTNASPGYTLFSTLLYTNTYLIDNDGQLVHVWRSQYVPGNSQYLRENGNLVRTADPGSTNFVKADPSGCGFVVGWMCDCRVP